MSPTRAAFGRFHDQCIGLEQALARLRWAVVDADQPGDPDLLNDRLDELTADMITAGGELSGAAGRAASTEPSRDPLRLVIELLSALSWLVEVEHQLLGSALRPEMLKALEASPGTPRRTASWSAGVLDALWPVALSVVDVHRASVIALTGAVDFIQVVDQHYRSMALVAAARGAVDREEVHGAIQPD